MMRLRRVCAAPRTHSGGLPIILVAPRGATSSKVVYTTWCSTCTKLRKVSRGQVWRDENFASFFFFLNIPPSCLPLFLLIRRLPINLFLGSPRQHERGCGLADASTGPSRNHLAVPVNSVRQLQSCGTVQGPAGSSSLSACLRSRLHRCLIDSAALGVSRQ